MKIKEEKLLYHVISTDPIIVRTPHLEGLLYKILEGKGNNSFDALIKNYTGKRDLLIEVKSVNQIDYVRHAIGQLFDYRRELERRHATDLAILLPSKPDENIKDLLKDLGINIIWEKGGRLGKYDGDMQLKI